MRNIHANNIASANTTPIYAAAGVRTRRNADQSGRDGYNFNIVPISRIEPCLPGLGVGSPQPPHGFQLCPARSTLPNLTRQTWLDPGNWHDVEVVPIAP